MPYAILCVSKLASPGAATNATEHNYRLQDTPNADPQLADSNVEYLNHERRNYWQLAGERIDELHLPRLRTDAVRAVELILSASPDFFARGADHRAHDVRDSPWVRDNLAFVQQRFGKENVVGFTLHQDEITPHIHCVVVPVTADGRLSSRDVFSPTGLRQLQTDYAKAMEPHGLTRGIHYSTARHEDIRRHYGAQQMSQEELRELAKPLQTQCHHIRSRADFHDEVTYRDIERIRLAKAWGDLLAAANHKITKLAAVATAHALAHERAKVLERQLANSQALLARRHEEFKASTTDLTKQLQDARQEAEQLRTRAETLQKSVQSAIVRHSQGDPIPEAHQQKLTVLRADRLRNIEEALTKGLLGPVDAVKDLAPDLAAAGKGYSLRVTSLQQVEVVSKFDGMRFAEAELRPNGRPFREQYFEAKQRTQQQNQPPLSRDRGGIEM